MKLSELFEMATPTSQHKKTKYYHGTDNEVAGEKIINDGFIRPPDLILDTRANLQPVIGKVYITPSLEMAQIYAIGGILAGVDYVPKNRKFGYIFQISSKDLSDIQPDEDSVGEMLYNALTTKTEPENLLHRKYLYLARRVLTALQYEKFKDGEYLMFAHLGKKLLKTMPDEDKLAFIGMGAHIAHTGKLKIEKAWKIDLQLIKKLKRDGSNFFKLAELVPLNKP